jgi:N-acetylmuramoyl-L-alanine amidase
MRIMIDPGHGGDDPGAVAASGLEEKVINLTAARQLVALLAVNHGVEVGMTRARDHGQSLEARCDIANRWNADLFISIHANSAASSAKGFEVWTSPGWTPADICATEIWKGLKLALPDRRARVDTADGDVDFENHFYVLTHTAMPAVLVELGFLSNPEEAALLATHDFIGRAVEGIWDGITTWASSP